MRPCIQLVPTIEEVIEVKSGVFGFIASPLVNSFKVFCVIEFGYRGSLSMSFQVEGIQIQNISMCSVQDFKVIQQQKNLWLFTFHIFHHYRN